MAKNEGAKQGETCGWCGEPVNPGAHACKACAAYRVSEQRGCLASLGLLLMILSGIPFIFIGIYALDWEISRGLAGLLVILPLFMIVGFALFSIKKKGVVWIRQSH